jgi:ribose transport system permease protein
VLLCIIVCIAIGAFTGLLNGLVISKLKVPAFIATLAGLTAWRGVTLLMTNSTPIPLPSGSAFAWLGQGYIGPIPVPVVIMLLTFGVGYLILYRMKIGRRIYAIGGNATAARLSGVKVTSVTMFVYIFSGASIGLAAAMATSRLNSGQPAGFVGLELTVIAAVVVGGTSLMGGYGQLSGTFLGALLLALLGNGLTLMDVPTYWQQILTGLVILFAVVLDFFVRGTKKARRA